MASNQWSPTQHTVGGTQPREQLWECLNCHREYTKDEAKVVGIKKKWLACPYCPYVEGRNRLVKKQATR